jgi:hypothetical protein
MGQFFSLLMKREGPLIECENITFNSQCCDDNHTPQQHSESEIDVQNDRRDGEST